MNRKDLQNNSRSGNYQNFTGPRLGVSLSTPDRNTIEQNIHIHNFFFQKFQKYFFNMLVPIYWILMNNKISFFTVELQRGVSPA